MRESLFGVWFQRTQIWRTYVLGRGVAELIALLGPDRRSPDRVLDLGCGDGAAFALLAEQLQPNSIVGIDIDSSSLEFSCDAARRCACAVEVRCADAARLPLESASIDLVFCHQTLHHVGDPRAALREIHRVLVPGGTLLLAESCRSFIELFWVRALFRHPMEAQRSAQEYLALLCDTGYEVSQPQTATSSPWWSRRDLGLRERWGLQEREPSEPTQICVVARTPQDAPARGSLDPQPGRPSARIRVSSAGAGVA